MSEIEQNQRRLRKFIAKVHITERCWVWVGTIDTNGYGISYQKDKSTPAHRVSYELLVGPIPKGMHIDHLCAVQRCVNPDHLQAVTQGENSRRTWVERPRTKKVVTTVFEIQQVEHVPTVVGEGNSITTEQAAQMLGVSIRAINYRAKHLNVGVKINPRLRLYSDADIERLAAYPKHGENLRRKT